MIFFQDTLYSAVRYPTIDWTTEKRETARSLLRKRKHSAKHARFSCLLPIFNRTYASLSRPA